jgi:hypothetical protein
MKLRSLVAVLACLGGLACSSPSTDPAPLNSLELILGDMQGPHEARPAGVPDHYDWSSGPRMGMGNNPGQFRALTAWGQLYEARGGNPARNTRVEFRNMATYVLSKRTGQWQRVQFALAVEGAAYREDFVNDESKAPDKRREPDGTVSVRAGNGFNYHFWPPGRASIDPADIGGVFTTVQARLILHDPAQPDDRATARYLLGMGADYWLDQAAQWDNFRTNGDVAIGKFRFVRPEWQAFNMVTLGAEALRRNPPPLE